jgi:preprotein translocase subunit SecF
VTTTETPLEPTPTPAPHHGLWSRLYHGETRANIVGRWKLWFALSGVVLIVGSIALVGNGLNLGLDFTGGTAWEVPAGKANVADVQSAMTRLGYDDTQVQLLTQSKGGKSIRTLRVEAAATATPAKATTSALDKAMSGLAAAAKAAPKGSARSAVEGVRDQLDGIEGPFRTAVPAELKDLQSQIDALRKALPTSKGKAALATSSAAAMRTSVDTLEELEQAERNRLGQAVSAELAKETGSSIKEVTVDNVGPSWGKQISEKARTALIVFLIAILLYITLRFEFRMAVATIVALLHDLLVVVGIYALLQFPVTPATVIAVLTILGFSIYDGIVVFDRVDENTKLLGKKSKMTYSEMANLSMNQVLMRSLNTSITALLPILSVLVIGAFVLGATTLEEFGLALFLGLMSGAYSSIFIATPLLALLKEREPRYRELRERLAGQGAGAHDHADADADASPAPAGVAPRPRKPGKRR